MKASSSTMQSMEITPDEQRFLLYVLSAFRELMDTPEQEEADSLVDRIQENRSPTYYSKTLKEI